MFSKEIIHSQIDNIFGESMHAKRVNSLSCAVKGTIESGKLAIHAIGSGLATCNSITRKHAIKQVDRLLSNTEIKMEKIFSDLIPFIIAERKSIVISMDWTEFDDDDQSVIVLSLQTNHGRNTPLVWKTVRKSLLKGKRTGYEKEILTILKRNLPDTVADVLIVADRGFGNVVMCDFIENQLEFDYLLRFKSNMKLGKSGGEQQSASSFLTPSGRAKTLTDMELTGKKYPVAKVYCCKKKGMKDAWFLVSNRRTLSSVTALKYYAKRWGIESGFRDIKDYRFGMGMRDVRMKSCQRRDRLFLLSALVVILLTLLGKAGDEIGLERTIKANTSKERTYSFFNQGCIYYSLLITMRESMLIPLMERFEYLLQDQKFTKKIFSVL